MNNPPGLILRSMEEKLREKVTVKPYDVTQGITRYCLLTGTSGRKFTAMFREKPRQMVLKEKDGNIYSKDLFLIEEENIRKLSRQGIAVPEILHTGKNFIIWPYLGENMPLDESIMSPSSRLDEIVLQIMEFLAAIHNLALNTIPYESCCTRYNLEFNFTFLNIIETSENDIARNIKNAASYGALRELIENLPDPDLEDSITKGLTYDPEIIFLDGHKMHHTDYTFTGRGDPFEDIVYPVSWGLPRSADEAVSKKQERVRHYISARKINDEQDFFLKFDYFTVLKSFNMTDVMFGTSNEKTKILYMMARRNMENLISGNPDLNEIREILLSSIPELQW
jgi:hypothetical protein